MSTIIFRDLDKEIDITEEVKMLFDSVIHSVDWGSGFLDNQEMKQVLKIGKLLDATSTEQMLDLEAIVNSNAHDGSLHEWMPDREHSLDARCQICGNQKRISSS